MPYTTHTTEAAWRRQQTKSSRPRVTLAPAVPSERLVSWQPVWSQRTGGRCGKPIVAGLCLLLVLSFLMLASSPLDTPRVQVVVLGHSATEGQASTAKLPATDRLASGVRQATDRVLEFTRSQSDVWSIEPNWRDDASESTWTGADADTTLLYLAGALFSDEHRVGIQVAGQDSGREPRVVDLGKRLRELSKRRSHVVLLVDALFEPTLKATTFPEFAAWQWTHAIERQLAVLPEDSISIVLQISQLPPTDEA